jgi:hypothetical protein
MSIVRKMLGTLERLTVLARAAARPATGGAIASGAPGSPIATGRQMRRAT